MNHFLRKNGWKLAVLAAAFGIFFTPIHTKASEENNCTVLVYAEQEGMGKVTATYKGMPFQDTITIPQGESIVVNVEVYPRISFVGWKKNGELKSTQYSYSFTADGPMCVVTAGFRQSRDYVDYDDRNLQDISTTSWANRTCRFQEGRAAKNVAVTTAMAVQGDACMAAFNSVLEDFTLARTYNITFTKYYNNLLEKLEEPAPLVFQIPRELQLPGRVFRMINVYKGQPAVLEDTDDSDATITFSGQNAGAYALVYKDLPAVAPSEDEEIDSAFSVMPDYQFPQDEIDSEMMVEPLS